MNLLKVKPLSVNDCFRGRRFRTKEYDAYEREILYLLPKLTVPKGKLFLRLTFGLSNKRADIDNPVKAFTDVLQKAYRFNDCQIYALDVAKEDVEKGSEFIEFELSEL